MHGRRQRGHVEILGRGNSSSVVVALLDLDGTVGPLPYTLGAKFFAPSQEHHVLLCPCTPDSLHTHSVCPLKQQRSQCHNFYKCSTLVLPLHQWSSQEDLLISSIRCHCQCQCHSRAQQGVSHDITSRIPAFGTLGIIIKRQMWNASATFSIKCGQ